MSAEPLVRVPGQTPLLPGAVRATLIAGFATDAIDIEVQAIAAA